MAVRGKSLTDLHCQVAAEVGLVILFDHCQTLEDVSARRSYRLGKRGSAVQQTRQQIVDAAIDECAPPSGWRTRAWGGGPPCRSASAPGTVTYHFSDRDALAAAVVRHLSE